MAVSQLLMNANATQTQRLQTPYYKPRPLNKWQASTTRKPSKCTDLYDRLLAGQGKNLYG